MTDKQIEELEQFQFMLERMKQQKLEILQEFGKRNAVLNEENEKLLKNKKAIEDEIVKLEKQKKVIFADEHKEINLLKEESKGILAEHKKDKIKFEEEKKSLVEKYNFLNQKLEEKTQEFQNQVDKYHKLCREVELNKDITDKLKQQASSMEYEMRAKYNKFQSERKHFLKERKDFGERMFNVMDKQAKLSNLIEKNKELERHYISQRDKFQAETELLRKETEETKERKLRYDDLENELRSEIKAKVDVIKKQEESNNFRIREIEVGELRISNETFYLKKQFKKLEAMKQELLKSKGV